MIEDNQQTARSGDCVCLADTSQDDAAYGDGSAYRTDLIKHRVLKVAHKECVWKQAGVDPFDLRTRPPSWP